MLDLEPDDEEVELELDDGDELLSAALTAIISANTAARLNNVTNFRLSILAPLLLLLLFLFFFSSFSSLLARWFISSVLQCVVTSKQFSLSTFEIKTGQNSELDSLCLFVRRVIC